MVETKIVSNISFNNKYIKNVKELYLFYRLRYHATLNGGSIKDFKFSNNEYYRVLPNLVNLGWVNLETQRVKKYRDICQEMDAKNAEFYMTPEMLQSLEAFKGALLATCESYIIHSKDKIISKKDKEQRSYSVKCKNNPLLKTKELEYNGLDCIAGRAFNIELSRLTGLSIPTITRWRRYSKGFEFNFYRLTIVSLSMKYQSPLNFLRKRIGNGSSFYSEKYKSHITKDLSIYTPIEVFRNKVVSKRKVSIDKFKKKHNLVNVSDNRVLSLINEKNKK
jgi:hypothetical protein